MISPKWSGAKWSRATNSFVIGCTIVFTVATLFIGRLTVRAQDESAVTFLVQLTADADPVQFSHDHQLTIVDAIDTISLYGFHGEDPGRYGELSIDPRVVTVAPNEDIVSFQSEQREFTNNDFENLQHYLGFGNGNHEVHNGNLNEQALVVRRNYSFAESWLTWWQADARLDRAHYYGTGSGVTVAVLDTGADLDHPALADHLVAGYDFVDDDTWPDDVPNGADEDEDGGTDEGVGHGTHISGVLAQVAPDVQIMPVRVLNSDGVGSLLAIVKGIIYAVDHGAQIINLSLSTHDHFAMLETAIAYAQSRDVIVIAAASGGAAALHFPAAYTDVISVGATRGGGYVAEFSAPYADLVDVFAPGELIYGPYYDGRYAWWSGSSMATPIVAGVAALLIEQGACVPTCVTALVTEKIQSVIPSAPSGRIDAYRASIYAHNTQPQQDICLLLVDQTALHPNLDSVAFVAEQHGVSSAWLLNEDLATPTSNRWLRWSESFSGDLVLLPGGRLSNAGWFTLLPTAQWTLQDFVDGHVSAEQLANVVDVIPLHNQELRHLLGRSCVALVYQDELTTETTANQTDLRKPRNGRLAFTLVGMAISEGNTATSANDSYYDLWLRIEPPTDFTSHFAVSSLNPTPDDLDFVKVSYHNDKFTIRATSSEAPDAQLYLSIATAEQGVSTSVAFLFNVPIPYDEAKEQYKLILTTDENLDGRAIAISSSLGGVANHTIGQKLAKSSTLEPNIPEPRQRLFLPLIIR